jgi:Tfp pilus assembly protein PilZ
VPSAAASSARKKPVARVVLFDLDEPTAAVLRDCFRQFGIQSVTVSAGGVSRLQREKFEACVLRLTEQAPEVLEAIRSSPSNSRMVIYGIGRTVQQTLSFSKYGVNAVFDDRVERQPALKVVRSTHLLVLHELRRYVRLPLITAVTLSADSRQLSAHTQEISAGGMSLESQHLLKLGDPVQLSFNLPNNKNVKVVANVCWVRQDKHLMGVRFDQQDERRLAVKEWIESYLEIA